MSMTSTEKTSTAASSVIDKRALENKIETIKAQKKQLEKRWTTLEQDLQSLQKDCPHTDENGVSTFARTDSRYVGRLYRGLSGFSGAWANQCSICKAIDTGT